MALTRPKFNNIDSTIVKISDAVLTVNQGNATQQTMGVAFDRSGWSLDSVGLIWNHNEQRFEVGTLSSNGVSSSAPSIVNYGTIKADTFSADTIESNALVISDLELINNSDTKGYEFFLTRSRGNISSPSAVQVGDEIFKITGNARNAIDYNRVVSIQSFSTGTNSANLEILLHDGSSLDTRLTLDNNGDLTIAGNLLTSSNITGNNIIGNSIITDNFTVDESLTIGTQQIIAQGTNGFSVNENFDPSNNNLQTAYHFTSGAGRETVAFTLARTGQFTDGFGIYGTAANNRFVMFGEQNNTGWEWRRGIGIRPLDLDGGTLVASLDPNGDLFVSGNVTGGNVFAENYFYSNGTPLSLSGGGGSSYTDGDVVNLLNNFGSNAITTSGNVTVGNFELTGTVTGNIVPSANAVYNLGSPTNRFNTLYLVGNTIDLGGATISADSEEGVVAIIPQIKPNQTTTKAILIGDSGIATADTDSFGLLSQSAIQEAMTNRVTVTGSLIANTLITTEGNIVAGNLKTDGLTIVRGIQSLGEDGITSGGNIQAPYFLGNGSLLTGLGNHYQDSDVANLLADLGPTSISTNSNITGNIITATRFVGNGSELTGITSSITVSEIDSGNTLSNSVGSITTLSFDIDSGFAVDDVGNGIAKVRTNSTFKTIVVDGQGNLVAQGLDTLEIISGNGISITTNPNSDPKSLTISGTYGDSNVSSLLTNYATTNYVDNELANLVASAPSTLDTLNELASALGNDAAFSTSITNLIGNNTSNIATLQTEVANLNYYDDTNVASYLTTYDGNITAGNILSDNYFYANGEPLSSANNVTVANTAPSSPNEGDVWIDTTDGVQYIYFNDGDSLQWVDMQSTIVNVGGGGYGDSDVLDYLGSVAGNIVPAANVTYNLGSETQRWNTLYLAGNTIDLGGAQIKADPDTGTIALIPQVKQGQTKTKAIVIGSRGISTVDTDTDGNVSAEDVEAASTSANTTTGNINATGVTLTNSLTVNTVAEISGNITAGNIITDNIFFSNGDPFVSGGGSSYDEESTSTGYFGLPVGNTAQRPETPNIGMVRFNSTSDGFEFYTNNSAWIQINSLQITNVSPTSFDGESGTSFTITGTGFTEGCQVRFVTAGGTEVLAGTVAINSLIQITATTGRDFLVSEEPLSVKITNPGGVSVTLSNVIDCGGSPTWANASGSLGTVYAGDTITPITLYATDPDGQAVTYEYTSGAVPTGLTSTTANGIITISGTVSANTGYNASGVTHNFDITASDGINESTRSFSILRKWYDGSTSALAAPDAITLAGYGITDNGLYYIDLGNSQGVQQVYCVMDTDYDGGGWMVWYGTPAGATSQTYRVSANRDDATTSSPLVGNYSLSYAKRSGIRAICTQTQSMVGRHHATDKLWLRLNNYIWNSTTHSSGNFNFETLMAAVTSTGATDSSVDVGLVNTSNSGGGDFGIAVDALDHHNTSTYYNLNGSCASQYLYQYGAGYKASTAFTGFNTTTSGCSQNDTNAFGFWIGMR